MLLLAYIIFRVPRLRSKFSSGIQAWKMSVLLVVMSASALVVSGQLNPTPSCDFEQDVVPDRTYFIESPGYPNPYPKGIVCHWFARAPSLSQIVLSCHDFSIPKTANCVEDRLSVSLTGNAADFHKYCGIGTFTVKSESNLMFLELYSPYYSNRGRFNCTMTVTEQPTLQPPPMCDCGWKKESRIVNGVETRVNEYPMMAGIVDAHLGLYCGTTIISNRYTITAAHCLLNKLPNNTAILVGDHDITKANETKSAKLYRVKRFIGHPQYNSVTQKNDIALIQVIDFIAFSLEVGPACLPFRNQNLPPAGWKVNVLGWGTTEPAGPKSDVLLEAILDVIDITECQSVFTESQVTDNQICTFRKGTDACQADSGGPLLWEGGDGRVRILGIISYGKSCATKYPGVNTRVGKYLQWILDSTPDTQYCIR